jgi:ABC-type branched-subunit amino acid transport system substrate-binding protein
MRRLGSLRLVLLALAFAVLAVGVAACGDDDDDGAAGEAAFDLTIGDLVPLTGGLSAFGPPGEKAADVAIEQIEQGLQDAGVEDVNVSIQHEDTRTEPSAGQSAARKLISDGATCLTGAWASSVTVPVAQGVSIEQGIPQISPASTRADITELDDDGFVYRTAPPDKIQAILDADIAEEELGGTDGTVSVAGRNDAYGEGLTELFVEEWESRGGTVEGPVLWDPTQTSFDSEAQQVVQGNPDLFFIVDFPDDSYPKAGAALLRTGDFDASKLVVPDGLALSDVRDTDIPLQALEGAKVTAPSALEGTEPEKAFDRLYTEAPGPGRQTFDAQNFDAVVLCFLAAVAAGSSDPEDIRDNLTDVSGPGGDKFTFEQLGDAITALRNGDDIDYDGPSGPIDFDGAGDPTGGSYSVSIYTDGKPEEEREFKFGDVEGTDLEETPE